ncbi:hypothetical protein EsDP_00002862 [Epichloe bromicola]|uniref:Uncharacterized protein n=1 Tax=Epichloe bromicola TaxID=79588 RepID=A0ABQ0CM23_9HYPO
MVGKTVLQSVERLYFRSAHVITLKPLEQDVTIMADKFDLKGTHEPPSLTLLPVLIAEDVELNIGEPNFVSGNSS